MFFLKYKQIQLFEPTIVCSRLISLKNHTNQKIKTQADLTNLLRNKSPNGVKKPIKQSNQIQQRSSNLKQYQFVRKNLNTEIEGKHLLKEEERIKFLNENRIDDKKKIESFKSQIIKNEKDFLNKASFKIHTDSLDSNGKELLKQMPFLNRASSDPKHLTLLHNEMATKIAKLIANQEGLNSNKIFVELNPGAGLLTDKLIEELSYNKTKSTDSFVLIETFRKFIPNLNQLIEKHSTTKKIRLFQEAPFNERFLHFSVENEIIQLLDEEIKTDSSPIVYGIVPWHAKGYMSRLFNDYAANRGFFQFKSMPIFYLYIPELMLAKLNPSLTKMYAPFNNSLTVISNMFSKCEVLSQDTSDLFFPYPQHSQPFTYNKYPFNRLDPKKLCLVRFKFKNETTDPAHSILLQNKHLFHFFLKQLFIRRSNCIRDSILKSICKNVDNVCRMAGLNAYMPVKNIQPFQFYSLFKYLLENPDQVINENLERVLYHKPNTRSADKERNKMQVKSIKILNKNFSGQLIVPTSIVDQDNNVKLSLSASSSSLVKNISQKANINSLKHYDYYDYDQTENDTYDLDENDYEIEHELKSNSKFNS